MTPCLHLNVHNDLTLFISQRHLEGGKGIDAMIKMKGIETV